MNIFCPNCENECSEAAAACPKCGHPLIGGFASAGRKAIIVVAGVLILAAAVWMGLIRNSAGPFPHQIAETIGPDIVTNAGTLAAMADLPDGDHDDGSSSPDFLDSPKRGPESDEPTPVNLGRMLTQSEIALGLRETNLKLAEISDRFWEIKGKMTGAQREVIVRSIMDEAWPHVRELVATAKEVRGAGCRFEGARIEDVTPDGQISAIAGRAQATFRLELIGMKADQAWREFRRRERFSLKVLIVELIPNVWLGPHFAKPKEFQSDVSTAGREIVRPPEIEGFGGEKSDGHLVIGLLLTEDGTLPSSDDIHRTQELARRSRG